MQRGLEGDIRGDEDALIGRAIVAADHVEGLSEGIAGWTQLRERVGEPMADGLAFSGLRALEEQAGRSAVMELARSVLGRAPPRDIRETIHEWMHPMPLVFERSTGRGWNEFLQDWEIWLASRALEPSVADLLARVPAMRGSVDVEVKEGSIRRIVARLVADDGADTSSMTLCTLLHVNLGPFDHELAREDLLREEVDCSGELPPIEVMGRYGPGERIFVAIEFESPVLGAPVRIAARRMEIE